MGATTTGIVDAALELVPALRERRLEGDKLRRLPDQTVQDILDLRILAAPVPPELGGDDLGVDAVFEACVALGQGDAATAWCAGNWAVHNLLLATFPVEAQREVFADGPMPIISTGFSPARATTTPTDGGAIVTGQWDFSSGVDHAAWVVILAVGAQGPMAHLIPTADLEIVDTWFTGGLKGTGSKDVAAKELFVPEHRIMPLGPTADGQSIARELYGSPWFRVPLLTFFHAGIVGAILGAATGALEVFIERTASKVGGLSGVKVGARPEVHIRIGEAAAEVNAATLAIRATFAEMREYGAAEREVTVLDRTRWKRDAAWGSKTAVAAVTRLFEVGGAHVLWDDDQLHQFFRDAHAASHHYAVSADMLFRGHGRVLLGEDPDVPML